MSSLPEHSVSRKGLRAKGRRNHLPIDRVVKETGVDGRDTDYFSLPAEVMRKQGADEAQPEHDPYARSEAV